MQSIRQVQRLNDVELEKCVPPNASWHTDYRDTAYIYIGGLPFELSEGDVLTIFSQYGNPVHINLVRDKETGKSKGFAFLKYEDQRSCDLAVDNLSGAGVMGRVISVDHTRYKKKEGEVEGLGDEADEGDETERESESRKKRRRTESESGGEETPMLKEERELAQLRKEMDDDDPMKAYLVKEKQAEVEEALQAVAKRKKGRIEGERHHKHRPHRSRRDDADGGDEDRRSRHRRRTNGDKAEDDDGVDRRRRHRYHDDGVDDEYASKQNTWDGKKESPEGERRRRRRRDPSHSGRSSSAERVQRR
ncbi:hypothetical protein BAUCODRAFT_28706 [Baudoinia panamericana UAMH 10762]|uniref:RRM domain-containing protein n=1 Tax=Baudoinia panamericana (strain UAMH 10762) TaxID=717646 RepID=M2MTV2_BAUPA|nr:uncharacterized protein BAUCODRAFT_28706 [Baudoinia panamericana UAMH 10762]EMD00352.1 hypothetical protein BAUCODRAFT_28706 [Baudoinia panamericana UAMH 10762]